MSQAKEKKFTTSHGSVITQKGSSKDLTIVSSDNNEPFSKKGSFVASDEKGEEYLFVYYKDKTYGILNCAGVCDILRQTT